MTDAAIIDALYAVIASRKGGDGEASYTARLFAAGTRRIAQKVGEEAIETALAAAAGERQALIGEAADLVYHLLVLLADADITPGELYAELERRKGTSGLAEKAARGK